MGRRTDGHYLLKRRNRARSRLSGAVFSDRDPYVNNRKGELIYDMDMFDGFDLCSTLDVFFP